MGERKVATGKVKKAVAAACQGRSAQGIAFLQSLQALCGRPGRNSAVQRKACPGRQFGRPARVL